MSNTLATMQEKLVSFANSCPAGTCPDVATIAKYEIKMVQIGLSAPNETTGAGGANIYVNPACPSEEKSFPIGDKEYKYISFGACDDESITTYLDLRKPAEEVNADLNSQYLPIPPSNYEYGMVTFCNDGDTEGVNYKITMSNDASLPAEVRGATLEVAGSTCGFDTPEFSPKLTITDGEAVVVNFEYDLTNTVYYMPYSTGGEVGFNCTVVGTTNQYRICAQPPTYSATFTKQ